MLDQWCDICLVTWDMDQILCGYFWHKTHSPIFSSNTESCCQNKTFLVLNTNIVTYTVVD